MNGNVERWLGEEGRRGGGRNRNGKRDVTEGGKKMQRRGDDAILHRCGRSALMDAAVGADTGRFFSAPLVILFHFLASSSTWCLQLAATPTVHLLIRSECCPIGAFLAVASLSLSFSYFIYRPISNSYRGHVDGAYE